MTPPLHHILCVDDESDILEVARLSLEIVGQYKVSVCCSGSQALDEVERLMPDLILLDVMMPKLNGPDTFAALKARPSVRDIPVALMTARVQPSEVAAYMRLGVCGVVAKPFDALYLANDVLELWETHHARSA